VASRGRSSRTFSTCRAPSGGAGVAGVGDVGRGPTRKLPSQTAAEIRRTETPTIARLLATTPPERYSQVSHVAVAVAEIEGQSSEVSEKTTGVPLHPMGLTLLSESVPVLPVEGCGCKQRVWLPAVAQKSINVFGAASQLLVTVTLHGAATHPPAPIGYSGTKKQTPGLQLIVIEKLAKPMLLHSSVTSVSLSTPEPVQPVQVTPASAPDSAATPSPTNRANRSIAGPSPFLPSSSRTLPDVRQWMESLCLPPPPAARGDGAVRLRGTHDPWERPCAEEPRFPDARSSEFGRDSEGAREDRAPGPIPRGQPCQVHGCQALSSPAAAPGSRGRA